MRFHTTCSTRKKLAVVGVTALALVPTACGRSDDRADDVASIDAKETPADADSPRKELTDAEREDAMVEYAACMREHGVDMPDPTESGGAAGIVLAPASGVAGAASEASGDSSDDTGEPAPAGAVDAEEFEQANDACGKLIEDAFGSPEPMSPEDQAKFRDQQLAFAKCMREHGIDLPDPEIDFGGAGSTGSATISVGSPGGGAGGVDPDDDTFREASEACGSELGNGGMMVTEIGEGR